MRVAAPPLVEKALRDAGGRMAMLHAVATLGLPDAWIAAGAIRNAVWDALHGYTCSTPLSDVDVVWFDPDHADGQVDQRLEQWLTARMPSVTWSVKNQARMHTRHGDAPYTGTLDAMRAWPETATAVATRLGRSGIECCAPYGVEDLSTLILRPTPRFASAPAVFDERVRSKCWLTTWPRLRVLRADDQAAVNSCSSLACWSAEWSAP